MTTVARDVAEIREIGRRSNQLEEAELRVIKLLDSLSAIEILENHEQIRSVIESTFLPKRKARLLVHLAKALSGTGTPRVQGSRAPAPGPPSVHEVLAIFRNDLHVSLLEIADRYLFQWQFYERFASRVFEKLVPQALGAGASLPEITAAIRDQLVTHSLEIYQRAYSDAVGRQGVTVYTALDKTTALVEGMLRHTVSTYQQQLTRLRITSKAEEIRGVCSAILAGTLIGRCNSKFGGISGSQHLLDAWKIWVQNMPFLTRNDIESLAASLPLKIDAEHILRVARPLAAALDERVSEASPDRVGVLRSCVYVPKFDRLDITLVEPIGGTQREVAFHCYLKESSVSQSEVESAIARGMELILVPITDDFRRWAFRHNPPLEAYLIDTSDKDAGDRLRFQMSIALATIGATADQGVPLTYNYARRFPLDKPEIGPEFRVTRLSVKRLLDQHHSETGVRVWCSVRRSGKTTACLDLQTHQGPEIVITETCESTGASTLKDSFYQAVVRALDSGTQLASDFVDAAIRSSADYAVGRSRIVFVLDEYESLFRRLNVAALRDENVRYAVVQPLLNQLVGFAQQNLVILMGLQPDAHFILMDQNQLSPYIKSDYFPLFEFEHNRPDCEFRELVRRVITDKIFCDDPFLGNLYAETGGHPVLTVNVLVALCEWLIASKRPMSELRLGASDFQQFAVSHLSSKAIGLEEVYDVHRNFARSGLSPQSRERTPWVYGVLNVLRYIAKKPDEAMSCTIDEVAALVARLGLDETAGIDAENLVRTGAMANWFRIAGRTVKPKIRLYARLTASVSSNSI